jgi:flagellar hook-basal body complex protein FliE
MDFSGKISPVDRIIAGVEPLAHRPTGPAAGGGEVGSFVSQLRQQLDEVLALQDQAGTLQQQLAAGQAVDINQVLVTVQKADLALNFALQLRNKVLEAYQEISRTQV